MPGPWEKYQQQQPSGPWEKYGEPGFTQALRGAEKISELPFVQRPLKPVLPFIPLAPRQVQSFIADKVSLPSPLELLDWLPAAGGTLGALGGGPVGAVVGAGAGEVGRMAIREAMGYKPATGLVQEMTGQDPDSFGAALTNVGVEAALGGAGELISRGMRAALPALERSSSRSLTNLLQPVTPIEKKKAFGLTERMVKEGVAPAGSTRTGQIARSESALANATAEQKKVLDALLQRKAEVPATEKVLRKATEEVPATIPGGAGKPDIVPRVGRAQRRAAENAAEDVADVLKTTLTSEGKVPLSVAQAEKQRWDKLLQSFYESGKANAPVGTRQTKVIADAWRKAISDEFPELGAANLRESELISITKMLKTANERIQRTGMIGAQEEAAATGAAVVGRMSIPAMAIFKSVVSTGPFASASAASKRAVAKLLEAPIATRQMWIRMGDFFHSHTGEQKSD
jgi:hypothetical protein